MNIVKMECIVDGANGIYIPHKIKPITTQLNAIVPNKITPR